MKALSGDWANAVGLVDPVGFDLPVDREVRFGRRAFPTRESYERALAAAGRPGALDADAQVAAAVQRHWHEEGQTGCLYAKTLARRTRPWQWSALVVGVRDGDGLPVVDAGRVERALQAAVAAPGADIVSLLFPGVRSLAGLKKLVADLASRTSISSSEIREHPGVVIISLRLPIKDTEALSWIMAFGPFAAWPPTRRGPVLEMAIRVKPKPHDLFYKLNHDPAAAHLADTQFGADLESMERLFERTAMTTRDVLGHDPDHLTAAKATFSFQEDEWDMAKGDNSGSALEP
jgi:hypothetical protein